MSTATTWNDPNDCPFCGNELQNPGAGFIDHIEANPDCEEGFETWRSQIADDICGGWSG
ncbi:DUF7501 family protein [Halorussus salinisoli]|uniref:DUF7501 family protein n=1 Tax=Halorussus salinisoli TaxID=2558242 RepID=UPI001484E9FE|nr:hypothetical protein [Halorussus salinisoli]